jgi:hypothetical protein
VAEIKYATVLCGNCAYDLGQHLAQPAAFVQHLAQVVGVLQQLPSHFMAGMVHEALLLVAQPVVINIPAAKTAASSIVIFMLVTFGCSWTPFYQ